MIQVVRSSTCCVYIINLAWWEFSCSTWAHFLQWRTLPVLQLSWSPSLNFLSSHEPLKKSQLGKLLDIFIITEVMNFSVNINDKKWWIFKMISDVFYQYWHFKVFFSFSFFINININEKLFQYHFLQTMRINE